VKQVVNNGRSLPVIFIDGSGAAFLNDALETVLLSTDTFGRTFPDHEALFKRLIEDKNQVNLAELIHTLGLAEVDYVYR